MSDHNQKAGSAWELIGSWFTVVFLILIGGWTLYNNSGVFIALWRGIRLLELTLWDSVASLLSVDFFSHYLTQLKATPAHRINWKYISAFESSLNTYMRFFYAAWLVYFGYCMQRNKKKVTEQFTVQSMIERYAHENEAIESLVHDNPLKHDRLFNFEIRDDFTNRHAQAISPQRYIEACPPPNATFKELQNHKERTSIGKDSSSRPIALIDFANSSLDFCRRTAQISLERQLTGIPADGGYYLNEDNAPRLFDVDGELIPLTTQTVKNNGKKETRFVSGFAQNGMINNGREFNGQPHQLRLLFNATEREVFDKLCRRYNHPSVSLADYAMELTKRHAYRRTYLAALFIAVDEHDIFASTEFYMLCRKDRALYFVLYSAREEKPFYEAIGVMSHYTMEILQGVKLVTPYVQTAVNTLEVDAKRISNKKSPRNDLINELSWNMVQNPDLKGARAYTDDDDEELTSLLKAKQTADDMDFEGAQ